MISMKTIRVIFIGILFCLLFISKPSFAQIYKWVDEKGTVNFTDDPDKVPVKYRTTVGTLDINPRESPSPTLSVRPEAKSHSDLSRTIQNKVTPGRSYYDAHPEERARDAATQANKPLMDIYQKLIEDIRTREQGYVGGRHRDYTSPSSPPPIPSSPKKIDDSPTVLFRAPGGAWGKDGFYPKAQGGLINPKTGDFMPAVKGGYLDPHTGKFIPGQ